MCFSSKKTRATFDDDKPKASSSSSQDKKQAPAPTATTTPPAAAAMSPKIAIVIYSMYGHIAKRTSPRSQQPMYAR